MLPPTEWKTVKQPAGSRLCGAAMVAMAVGESLKYATDRMPAEIHPEDGQPWYRTRSVLAFLGQHGICCGMYLGPQNGLPYFEGCDLGDSVEIVVRIAGHPAIVSVKSDTFPDGEHYVFWDGANIRDPNPKMPDVTARADYLIIDWTPLIYIDES